MCLLSIWCQIAANEEVWNSSLPKAFGWHSSTRAEMDFFLHFRSSGFVPYFHSLTKGQKIFSNSFCYPSELIWIMWGFYYWVSFDELSYLPFVGLHWNVSITKFSKLDFERRVRFEAMYTLYCHWYRIVQLYLVLKQKTVKESFPNIL